MCSGGTSELFQTSAKQVEYQLCTGRATGKLAAGRETESTSQLPTLFLLFSSGSGACFASAFPILPLWAMAGTRLVQKQSRHTW